MKGGRMAMRSSFEEVDSFIGIFTGRGYSVREAYRILGIVLANYDLIELDEKHGTKVDVDGVEIDKKVFDRFINKAVNNEAI